MKYLLIPLIFSVMVANSQTSIAPGYVSGTWDLEGSPYLIQGTIQIADNTTLTIEPGVTVNFQGHYKLMVLGQLIANGNATDSIYFTATNTLNGWYGIRFDNTSSSNDSSKISFANIQWGKATGTLNDANGGGIMLYNFSKVSITNCLIKNCSSINIDGGGIFCNNSNPIISNNTITYCSGGILIQKSNPEIKYNNISYNSGRGIFGSGNTGAIVNIQNNTVSHNTATGIFVTSANITNNTISYNTSSMFGGGVRIDLNDESIISNNIISYNTSTNSGYGGGIDCYLCKATITNNIISNNSAINGAGIGFMGGGNYTPIVSNNIITNNTASGAYGYGGGIYITGADPIIDNNTIANNTAIYGGGIYFSQSSSPSVNNTILNGNSADIGGDQVFISDELSDPNFYYCNIEGSSTAFELNGNFYSGIYSNNPDSDPLFISPSSGGGYTFDGANANWSLQSNSPCIDAGNPSGTYPSVDIAGNQRIVGESIDIGAYEISIILSSYKDDFQDLFSFYPNPTSLLLTIDTELDISETTILNSSGYVIKTIKNNTKTINISSLQNGVYLIKIVTQEGEITKKFVKQ